MSPSTPPTTRCAPSPPRWPPTKAATSRASSACWRASPTRRPRSRPRATCCRSSLKYPLPVACAAGDAGHLLLLPALGARKLGGELAAVVLALLEVARGRQAVGNAGLGVRPLDRILAPGELERVAHAGTVALVDGLPDFRADDRADGGADQDRDRPILPVGARADRRADDTTDHRPDRVSVALAFDYAVVLLPFLAGIADVVGVVLLAPAVRLGVIGRRGGRGHRDEYGGNQRDERCVRGFHASLPWFLGEGIV